MIQDLIKSCITLLDDRDVKRVFRNEILYPATDYIVHKLRVWLYIVAFLFVLILAMVIYGFRH